MGAITQHLPISTHGITYPESTMPPRRLSLGAGNRYIIQTIAYSSQYSCPIPSWATESAQTEISDIEKLKHFCGSNCGYLYHPDQLERRSVWGRSLAQVLCLMGLAMPLSLYASKSYSQAGLDHALRAVGLEPVVPAPSDLANADFGNVWSATSSSLERTDLPAASGSRQLPQPLSQPLSQTRSKTVTGAQSATIPQTKALTAAPNITAPNTAAPNTAAPNTAAPKLTKLSGIEQSGHQFSLPVTGFAITSSFGNRIHPLFGNVRFHKGIDLGTPTGTPIRAARDGRVVSAGWGQGYGNRIIIDHGNGYETLYAHLDRLVVKVGDRVTKEAVIGLSGSTGYVTGPHLHFEIRFNQVAQNPMNYFGGLR